MSFLVRSWCHMGGSWHATPIGLWF